VKKIKQHRNKVWFLLGIVFFMAAVLSIFFFAVPKGADIEVVLRGEAAGMGGEPLILFSVFAFTMATVSVAKGYEVFKHEREKKRDLLQTQLDELRCQNSHIHSINNELAEKHVKTRREKNELSHLLNELHDESRKKDEHEKLLHKSILVLKNDIEKLLSQKKELLFEVNRREPAAKKVKMQKTMKKKIPKKGRRKNAKA